MTGKGRADNSAIVMTKSAHTKIDFKTGMLRRNFAWLLRRERNSVGELHPRRGLRRRRGYGLAGGLSLLGRGALLDVSLLGVGSLLDVSLLGEAHLLHLHAGRRSHEHDGRALGPSVLEAAGLAEVAARDAAQGDDDDT